MTSRLPTIRTARHIAKAGELDGVVIVGIAGGEIVAVSYGRTIQHCRDLAPLVDFIAEAAGREVPLPSFAAEEP